MRVKDSEIKVGQPVFTSYLKAFDVNSDLLSTSAFMGTSSSWLKPDLEEEIREGR